MTTCLFNLSFPASSILTNRVARRAAATVHSPNRALPEGIEGDRTAVSEWIDAHKPQALEGPFAAYPSAKQVAFAERIARLKRRDVPQECFRDKTLMSRWIDGNKPR